MYDTVGQLLDFQDNSFIFVLKNKKKISQLTNHIFHKRFRGLLLKSWI